jgi:Ser/Thr protein kinase RdoA (MazF antagonist)
MSAPSRARITAGELVVVCSHYDLGAINEVRRFRGGSRLAPKVLISTSNGEYLLKRRAPGTANAPTKVAFTHEVILHLAARGFPVPPMIGTRSHSADTRDNSMLQLGPASPGGGGVYEVFRFVRGRRYSRTADESRAAGVSLASCHTLLADFQPLFPAPRRTFHNHGQVPERLMSISTTLSDPAVRSVCRALADAYLFASERAERFAPTSSEEGPEQIVHGDWHPGNMLFTEPDTTAPGPGSVAAVFDFDSARLGRPLHDMANGAMQFSVTRHMGVSENGEGIPPSSWRIALDPDLFAAFCAGYRGAGVGKSMNAEALRAVPWLMIEAMIVEVGVPIAGTGKFGKLDAKPVLGVVHRATEALTASADRLTALASGR